MKFAAVNSWILQIESSTTMCSVALAKDGQCVSERAINDGYSHAEQLAPFVDELLKENNIAAADLSAVAVGEGPGSYTGLRIGVSLAKGICFSANIPLIVVNSLELMCWHPAVRKELNLIKDALLAPMLDARRMEVYTAIYDVGLKAKLPVQPMILDEQSYASFLSEEAVLFFGNGAEKFQSISASPSARFIPDVWPVAAHMSALAFKRFEEAQFADLAYFEPAYLKPFQATKAKPLL